MWFTAKDATAREEKAAQISQNRTLTEDKIKRLPFTGSLFHDF
jgi:hypothetical protein